MATVIQRSLFQGWQSIRGQHRSQKCEGQREERVLNLDHFEGECEYFEEGWHSWSTLRLRLTNSPELFLQSSPLCRRRVWNSQVIQNAEYQMVDESFNGLRTMIETRTRRNDMGAGARQAQHVFQMNRVIRCFARHQHQLATLFQSHIRSPMNQVCARSGSNRPERAH